MKNETNAERVGRIGFVGAGKVGFSFGRYFMEHGYAISGYLSAHEASAKEAAEFTQSHSYRDLKELVENSDTLFITVPDGQITDVWDHMKQLPMDMNGKVICHASGSLTSEIFSGMDQFGISGFSVHPLFAISDKYESYKELSKCFFTIEGKEGEKRQQIVDMLIACGNMVECILPEHKAMYHAAAVVVSNFSVALSYLGSEMLTYCGFSQEHAQAALAPIYLGNAENVVRQGALDALTGPVERNDVSTIQKHLQAFADAGKQLIAGGAVDGMQADAENREKNELLGNEKTDIVDQEETNLSLDICELTRVYKDLTQVLIKIGQQKHKDFNYERLKEVLSE